MKIERLQKYISACGVMSRRAAEKAIEEGRVTVNGIEAKIGDSVSSRDVVRIDGKKISQSGEKIYLMMYVFIIKTYK